MTKQELLASLKPLKWHSSGYGYMSDDIDASWCAVKYSIMKLDRWYILSISQYRTFLKKEVKCDFFNEAKEYAQEHYNNLVLDLFNLEG